MANYQPPHSFALAHPGENNAGAQSAGVSHQAQLAQGVMDGMPAHPMPTQTPAANEAEEAMGSPCRLHTRINFNPTHTCAACKQAYPNNYALERHAAKERHKAFLCTCTTTFVRLATLNRHIAAQVGPQFYCDYCDGNKGFAREDKLIDHLRASHKFGEKAIAHFRSQARVQVQGNGHAPPTVATTTAGQHVSTSAGYEAGSDALSVGQKTNSAGTSAGPSAGFDGGANDFPMFSATEHQPFTLVEDYAWTGAAEGFAGFDVSGLDFSADDFADFDWDMDLSGMDNHL